MHALLTTLLLAFPVLSPMPQDVVPDDKDSFEVHGGVRIVVNGQAYEAVDEVAEPRVRAFIQQAIAEWQERQ